MTCLAEWLQWPAMPLEGHWERQNTPIRQLTRREWVAVLIGTVLAVAAVVALLVGFGSKSRPAPGPGCIRATISHVMGAEELNACDAHARRICADAAGDGDPNAVAILAACRQAGVGTARQ